MTNRHHVAIGKVIVDEETGTVIMIDTQDKLEKMNALLDSIEPMA